MPKQTILVIPQKCRTEKCSPVEGICAASKACPKSILIQEDAFEAPMLTTSDMCTGCGDCVRTCMLHALYLG